MIATEAALATPSSGLFHSNDHEGIEERMSDSTIDNRARSFCEAKL